MSSSNDVQVLETFTDQPITVDLSRLRASVGIKSVEQQFKKIKRIGEGTYGTVCKFVE